MGGYQIIDLQNKNFSDNDAPSHVIDGVYSKIESTRKPILITNFVIDGIKQQDVFAFVTIHDSEFVLSLGTDLASGNNHYFEVADTDVVTYRC